eukprot:TRINITY_DN12374_c0_g2_i1.p1 TRINITY_DN12374_c0_g2~~TRINITY_DN12374_c0_g2_i1.p1  ORF type:complete len:474 (+),score=182.84 TRINITY_DN12374_c0_g2_i1:48-1469(+)
MGLRPRFQVDESKLNGLKEVSWKEVAKHNTKESCWVIIDDVAYDMTTYVDRHPGGSELLLTFAGREATHAFNAYHALSEQIARARLSEFAVAKVIDSEHAKYPKKSVVYDAMKDRLTEYFEKTKKDPKDWRYGFGHFMIMMAIAAFSLSLNWGVMPGSEDSWQLQLLGAILFGWIQALPLLHLMHDCSHGAFSHKPWAWDYFGKFTMDLYAGASMTAWHLQHVVGHHVWTNGFGADPDLPPAKQGDPRYLVKLQEHSSMYQYQHIYLPIAYSSLGLKVRISDLTHAWGPSPMAGPMRIRKHTAEWKAKWILIKTMWVMWRIVFPIVVLGMSLQWYFTLFIVSDMITGWYLAFNFQVSHISTLADYPFGAADRKQDVCEDEWAVSQIKTSVDYSHDSPMMTWMCGALNYQTVHHLFPGISQYHYPAIAPVLQEVAKEHGIKWNYLPSFASAFGEHVNYLKIMGQRGEAAEFHMG